MENNDLPGINRKNVTGWLTERSEVTGKIHFDVVTHAVSYTHLTLPTTVSV